MQYTTCTTIPSEKILYPQENCFALTSLCSSTLTVLSRPNCASLQIIFKLISETNLMYKFYLITDSLIYNRY